MIVVEALADCQWFARANCPRKEVMGRDGLGGARNGRLGGVPRCLATEVDKQLGPRVQLSRMAQKKCLDNFE